MLAVDRCIPILAPQGSHEDQLSEGKGVYWTQLYSGKKNMMYLGGGANSNVEGLEDISLGGGSAVGPQSSLVLIRGIRFELLTLYGKHRSQEKPFQLPSFNYWHQNTSKGTGTYLR